MSWKTFLRSLASCDRSRMRAKGDTAGPPLLVLLDSTAAAEAVAAGVEDGGVYPAELDGSGRCALASSWAFSIILDSEPRYPTRLRERERERNVHYSVIILTHHRNLQNCQYN